MSSVPSAPDSVDLERALKFVRTQFRDWRGEGRLRFEEAMALDKYYDQQLATLEAGREVHEFRLPSPDVCWDCRAEVPREAGYCPDCHAPVHNHNVERLRHLILICHEVRKHEQAGRLSLQSVHRCMADGNGRISSLRKRLTQDRLGQALPAGETESTPERPHETPARSPRRPERPPTPARSILEIVLDPKTIQWLLGVGGVLLVLGLVIYLIAAGILQDAFTVAVLLGAGNVLLLASGWWVARTTRYDLIGRALTLVACLLLPFNLWFYDTQGLLVLHEGAPLYLPALVCCVLYVISAWITRDPVLAHVIVAGIALTGMLILADRDIQQFADITGPVTFLVLLGVLCIHLERLFPESETPFSRGRFGLQFFFAGQAVLGSGLLILLVTQLYGGMFAPMFGGIRWNMTLPAVITTTEGRVLALGLVLLATYGYLYSDLVVRKVGVYLHIALFTLLWSEVLGIGLITQWPIPPVEVAILALVLTAVVLNLGSAAAGEKNLLARTGPTLSVILSTLPVLLGVVLRIAAYSDQGIVWKYHLGADEYVLGESYIITMVIAALACRLGAHLYRKRQPQLSVIYFFGTAAATLTAADALLITLWPDLRWNGQAPVLMMIPLLYLIAARLYRGRSPQQPLNLVAMSATGLMLFLSLGTTLQSIGGYAPEALHLNLALFFAEAALFFVLDSVFNARIFSIHAATVLLCGVVWQMLGYLRVETSDAYVLTFAGLGVALLAAYRFALLERFRRAGLESTSFDAANAMLMLSLILGMFMTLPRLPGSGDLGRTMLLPALLAVFATAATYLTAHAVWRQLYVAMAVTHTVLAVLALAFLNDLTFVQKVEMTALIVGSALLIVGHIGWYREKEQENDLVSSSLLLGSLLVGIPFVLAVVAQRVNRTTGELDWFHTFNEIGALAAGVILFGAGYACRIRATTVTGALLSAVYLLTLVLYLRIPHKLQNVAVYMIVGGGIVFGLGLLLSFYRERLLSLPERIRRREGLFRVLNWR